jgi:NADH dehydrogenase FAD-containing subunit
LGATQRRDIVPANWLDERGRVKVEPTLRVTGQASVFCIGDANNVDETKLGYYACLHAELTVKNIFKLFGNPNAQLKKYTAAEGNKDGVMFIPLGPKVGVAAIGKTILGNANTSLIKGKGLFTKKTFSDRNAPLPTVKLW